MIIQLKRRHSRLHRILAIMHKDTNDLFVKFVLQALRSVTLLSLQISELCSNLPQNSEPSKGGSTLVTLPRTVTPYRHSVDGTRDHVTYRKLVTLSHYGLVRCAVGIWPSHQRDDMVTAWAGLDVQRDTSPPSAIFSFSLKRNVHKCTKPLIAAKTSLGLP